MKQFFIVLAWVLVFCNPAIAGKPFYTDAQKHQIARVKVGTTWFMTRKAFLKGNRMGAIERRMARSFGNREWRCETEFRSNVLVAKCATSGRLKDWVYQINRGNNSKLKFILLPQGTAGIVAPVYLETGWKTWYSIPRSYYRKKHHRRKHKH